MKCKEIYRENKMLDSDDSMIEVVGTVTTFTQRIMGDGEPRYAIYVFWCENGEFAGKDSDILFQEGMSQAQAIRRCIDLIDLAAYRLSRPQNGGVKVADSTDDDEDICF